jgi:hypothetical protein
MDTAYLDLTHFGSDVPVLLRNSILFVSYAMERETSWWHDVVIYGVMYDELNVASYPVMNPSGRHSEDHGRGDWWPAGYQRWDKGKFFPAGNDVEALVGWKAQGRVGRVR